MHGEERGFAKSAANKFPQAYIKLTNILFVECDIESRFRIYFIHASVILALRLEVVSLPKLTSGPRHPTARVFLRATFLWL